MLGAEAGGELPVLALDVMDDRRARPGQERRDDEADAFARSRRREAQHMLRPIVAQIAALVAAQHDAIGSAESSGFDLLRLRPAGRAVGLGILRLAGAPDGHADRDSRGDDPTRCGDVGSLDEDVGRVGVVGVPPPEEGRRKVEREMQQLEPRVAELWLEAEAPGRPLRRAPDRQQDDRKDGDDLAPENLGRGHRRRPFMRSMIVGISHRPSPRLRPKPQSIPPSARATPETWRPSCFSRVGVQGTSWKPRPSSIMAKRPEASAKRCR